MKYNSTRGGDKGVSFKDVLFMGYANDQGMFLPESVKQIGTDTLRHWAHLSFQELAFEIVSCFLTEDDIPPQDLKDILRKSYSTFEVPDIVPITRLTDGLVIAELYYGRSLSFKDLSTNCMGNLLNYFLLKENRHVTLLIATSGDTGSSVIEAIRGLTNIDVVVVLPRGRITDIQERQMTTALDSNVHVFRLDGSSDDTVVIIDQLLSELDYKAKHSLGSASSLNFGRILFQMVHTFYTYLKVCPEANQEVEIIIPTGGAGNVTAGVFARKMGLPIKFCCAVNHNNALSRFMETGQCDIGEVEVTIAPAIDIQFPYNVERLWFMASGDDTEEIKKIMAGVSNNKINASSTIMNNLRKYIRVYTVSGDEEALAAMKRCWEENGYKICPHTAVGMAAVYSSMGKEQNQKQKLRAVLATASPLKFPEAARLANVPVSSSDKIDKLMALPTRYIDIEKGDDWVGIVKKEIEKITSRVNK